VTLPPARQVPLTRAELLERARAKRTLLERGATESLGTFANFHDPVLVVSRALYPLYSVWDRIYHGEQVYALIEAPPRHGKSTNCFYGFARHLKKHPHHLIGYGTYNGDFAASQSRIARSLAEKCGVWSNEVEDDTTSRFDAAQTIAHWQTSSGGGAKFFGRGTSVLGTGFNVALIDDPIKNHEEAESEATLESCWKWALASVFNRLEPGGSFMAMHQRWTDGDLIGRFKARIESGYADAPPELRAYFDANGGIPWTVVTLKAIQDDGSPLMPERFDLLALMRIRVEVTDFWWQAQYMQDPQPASGRMFPEQYPVWSTWVDSFGQERGLSINGEFIPVPMLEGKFLVFGIDTAGSDNVGADETAIVLLACWYEHDPQTERPELIADVVHVWADRLKSPDVVTWVHSICSDVPAASIAFEMMSEGRAQGEFLKQDYPELDIDGIKTHQSKRLRAGHMANGAKRGRLRLPAHNAPWVQKYKAQLSKFTGQEGKRDDKVDAGVHAWNKAKTIQPATSGLLGDERAQSLRGGNY
jgi:predicted phage terminase large subunit-like protein